MSAVGPVRIPPQKEQEELLCRMVEAFRAVPRRREFYLLSCNVDSILEHPGFPHAPGTSTAIDVYDGDVPALVAAGLVMPLGSDRYDITPRGFAYYEQLKRNQAEPLRSVEEEVLRFLDAVQFRSRQPRAHDAWARAAAKLWGADSDEAFTEIGHACREAMQHFTDQLVMIHGVDGADPNPTKTVSRLRTVVQERSEGKGESDRAFLDALVPYWGTVVDLVQRQEHGALKEGEALTWEDARRVVFQTAVVMYEIDRACTSANPPTAATPSSAQGRAR